MADNHFDLTMVWGNLGGGVRVRREGLVQVLDPATNAPLTVVQDGVSTTIVTSDDNGRVTFVAQQGTVKLVADGMAVTETSVEAATAGAANAAAAAASQSAAAASAAAAAASLAEVPVAPSPNGTNDTSNLQTFITANAGKRVVLSQAGAYLVNGALTVPAGGIRIDMQGASITQTASSTPIFTTSSSSGLTVSNGTLVGKSTDYADTTSTYVASAIRATAGAKKVRLIDCTVRGFAGAAVYATTVVGLTVRGCDIVGVGNGGGGGTFAFNPGVSKDNAGVIFDGNSTRVWVVDNEISYTAQGVLGGTGSKDVHVRGNTIHDVGGQHGVYLNYGSSFDISGNTITNVAGAGVKVQTQSGGADCTNVAIVGNTVDTAAANGIILTCDTGSLRHKNFTVVGNTVLSAANDGIVLEYVANGVCTGNVVTGARAGIRVTDFASVSVKNNRISTTTEDGILAQALDFSSTDVTISSNEIRNPASANGAATEFGIRVAAFTGMTTTVVKVSDNDIQDSLGNMKYGLYYSTADQSTYSTINNFTSGATDYGFRGPATAAREFRGNNLSGTLGAIHTAPTNFVTNPDTSGAALAALETEVNELKATMRSAGLIR